MVRSLFSKKQKIVTRFAPSPTGYLHLGNYRTAVFNYLLARSLGGTFILRIEDTDRERSTAEFKRDIVDSLAWLTLPYDAIYTQTERVPLYTAYLETLLKRGAAYFSTEERDGKQATVIRFKNPGRIVTFTDLIRGTIAFDTTELGDFIIARSIDSPLFHFAVVLDDWLMGITHIVRGEDHISNTPRQILIQEALGAPRPQYAHLPLVLAADRSKLSKRNGGISIRECRAAGYVPEAIVNYLALLGWTPPVERELWTIEDLANVFTLERIHHSGAVFDLKKLEWYNREYMKKVPDDQFLEGILSAGGKELTSVSGYSLERLRAIIPVLRERLSRFGEITNLIADAQIQYFFSHTVPPAALLLPKGADSATTSQHLKSVREFLHELRPEFWNPESIKTALMPYADQHGRGAVLWPTRVALSGLERSVDPFTLAALLGKEETLTRLNAAIEALS